MTLRVCDLLSGGGGWMWTDGREVGFTAWAPGEPSDGDGSEGENCVEVYTSSGRWNDVACSAQNGFVCMVRRGEFLWKTRKENTNREVMNGGMGVLGCDSARITVLITTKVLEAILQ
jgi:hypothetical protein